MKTHILMLTLLAAMPCPHSVAAESVAAPVPEGFSLIPAGSFRMGDQSNPPLGSWMELPVHTVYVSAFYMAKYETTGELWASVRSWGRSNGYPDISPGNFGYLPKGENHPVHSIYWHDIAKWCNARSEKEGLVPCYTMSGNIIRAATDITGDDVACNWNANGYRLPTEAEWEKAARGGQTDKIFPFGNTITHGQANYFSMEAISYDLSPTRGYHPTYGTGEFPYSSPVGSFAPNNYGLYDMSGNMMELCWGLKEEYTSDSQINPRGPQPNYLCVRGSSWMTDANHCRVSARTLIDIVKDTRGFRLVRGITSQEPLAPEIAVEQPEGRNLADGASTVGFGTTPVGKPVSRTFTIRNMGPANLTGLAVTKSGNMPKDFTVETLKTSSLAWESATTFTVTFTPAATGTRTATLHISSNDADENPFDIALTGTGLAPPAPEIVVQQPAGKTLKSGDTRNFQTVKAGTTSKAMVFTIRNAGGKTLKQLGVGLQGKDARHFTVTKPKRLQLAPKTSTTFRVTFKPQSAGRRNAVLSISSNDTTRNTIRIKLKGKGVSGN